MTKVHDYGAYAELDEFAGVTAFIPWSEISSKAFRRVEEVLKEGQKVVGKVLRVYKDRMSVDVSLKRTLEGERRRKMLAYKRYVKTVMITLMVASKLGKTEEEAYREVVWKLEDAYGDPLVGLERALIEGPETLRSVGISEEWIVPLLEAAAKHIELKTVRASGFLVLQSLDSDGIEKIRRVLLEAQNAATGAQKVRVRIYTVGAPRYSVDVEGYDYKSVEKALNEVVKKAEEVAKSLGVSFAFERAERR
ncbi:MAG: translation initiation factor IF-2 subunit alpha [Acidilobaceae archaeon]